MIDYLSVVQVTFDWLCILSAFIVGVVVGMIILVTDARIHLKKLSRPKGQGGNQ